MRELLSRLAVFDEVRGRVPSGIMTLVVGCFATLAAGGYFAVRLGTGPSPSGDIVFLLLTAKSALAGLGLDHLDFMAFPDGLSFARFPVTDYTQLLLLKVLAVVSDDVLTMWSAFHISVVVMNFAACYVLFLSITGKPFHAAVLGFGCQFFAFVSRMTGHNFLFAEYGVPLGCYLIVLAFARDAIVFHSSRVIQILQTRVLPIVCVAFIALSGLYFLFFFLAISAFLLAFNLLTGRREVMRPALTFMVSAGALFLLTTILYYPDAFFDPAITSPRRSAREQPTAALRLADALLEYGRNAFNPTAPVKVKFIENYANARDPVEGYDAFSGPLLTLMVLATPFLLLLMQASGLKRWFGSDHRWRQLYPTMLVGLFFVLLFAQPWSYGMLFNQLITPAIRSQNRISVFMNLFAAIMLYGLICHWLRDRPRFQVWVLLLVFVINDYARFGYWSSYHRSIPDEQKNVLASTVKINAMLPPSKDTVVLQMPYGGFPEVPNIGDFQPYSHFLLPVMFPENDVEKMPRWSYGGMRGQMSHEVGKVLIGQPEKPDWSRNARCLGYNRIVLEKRAYAELPVPDRVLWQMVYDDALRQLWEPIPGGNASCPATYSGDYRLKDDRRLLYGEDRTWWVDEFGGTLRGMSAQLAVPLPALQGKDVCIEFDAILFDRIDNPHRNHRLFLSLGDQEFGFEMSEQTLPVRFRFNVPEAAWKGSYFFVDVSQYGKSMSYLEEAKIWWRSRKAMIGLQSLSARRCLETS